MNKLLVFYDASGRIYQTCPALEGAKQLVTEVPDGTRIIGIDTGTQEPIFEDIPKTDIATMQEKINSLEEVITEILLGGV